MQQDLCVMEMEGTEVTERTPHNIYKQNLPDLNILLLTACQDLATKLWECEYINDILHDKIMDKGGVAASDHEMVRVMLNTVYRLMKEKDGAAKWDGFIKALRREPMWGGLVETLETELAQAKLKNTKNPEATALKKHMNGIANTVQGGFGPLANDCEAYGVFTFTEKQEFTDPNNKHELFYTQKMLDEVGVLISKDEQVFYGFLEILESIGGPVQSMAGWMKECCEDHR